MALTKDNGMLCGGFEDSSVRVWSLTPKKLVKQKGKTADISKVNLSFGKIFLKKNMYIFFKIQ